jgi:AcrR family transcriptional regulator
MYVNKKAEASQRTRAALEAAGRELFETRGFADVGAEEVVALAGVTRGALYHHYDGKEGLFAAVAEGAMQRLHAEIAQAAASEATPRGALHRGVTRFLELASEPALQRLLFVDAPTVLGWPAWRGLDDRYGLGLLKQGMRLALAGLPARQADVSAHLLLGALIEAAMWIAHAEAQADARCQAEAGLRRLLDGLLAASADNPASSPGEP